MRKHRKNPITEGIRLFHGQVQAEADLLKKPFSNIALRSPDNFVVNRELAPTFYSQISRKLNQKPQLAYTIGSNFSFRLFENMISYLYIMDQALLDTSSEFKLKGASNEDLGITDFFLGFHEDSSDTNPIIKVDIESESRLSLIVVVQTPLVFTGKSKIQNLANATFDAIKEAIIKKHYPNLAPKDLKKKKLPVKTKIITPIYNRLKDQIATFTKGQDFEELDELFRVFNANSGQELDSQDVSEALVEEAAQSLQEDLVSTLAQVETSLKELPLFGQQEGRLELRERTSTAPIDQAREREMLAEMYEDDFQEFEEVSSVSLNDEGDSYNIEYTVVDKGEDIPSYSQDEISRLSLKFSDDISELVERVEEEVGQVAASAETKDQLDPSIDTKAAIRHIQDAQIKLEYIQGLISRSQKTKEDFETIVEELKEVKNDIYEVFQQGFQVGTETDIDSNIIKDITHRLNAFADYYNLEGDYVYQFEIHPKQKKVSAKYDGANAIDVTLGPKNTIIDIVKALAPELHDMWSSEEYDFDDVRIDPYLIEQELLTLK